LQTAVLQIRHLPKNNFDKFANTSRFPANQRKRKVCSEGVQEPEPELVLRHLGYNAVSQSATKKHMPESLFGPKENKHYWKLFFRELGNSFMQAGLSLVLSRVERAILAHVYLVC